MSLTNCPSCKHWIYTGWGNGMCNLGIGNCKYEMSTEPEPKSLYPSIPNTTNPSINPGLEAEINKQTKLLEDILAELKMVNDFIYRHERNQIRAEEEMYKAAMKSFEDMKKLEDDCVGVCEEESDEH